MIHPIKGKPETGIYAAVICPPPTIRFPSAASFESEVIKKTGNLSVTGLL
jgi:hypothetical protein